MANIIYFDQDAIVGHHAKMPHLVRMFNSGQGSEKRPAVYFLETKCVHSLNEMNTNFFCKKKY